MPSKVARLSFKGGLETDPSAAIIGDHATLGHLVRPRGPSKMSCACLHVCLSSAVPAPNSGGLSHPMNFLAPCESKRLHDQSGNKDTMCGVFVAGRPQYKQIPLP